MQAQPHPDEARRLEALRSYGVLDTETEEDFDELVALAARICEVPVSLVSLVDAERQWFKAAHGIDIRETPRDFSICAHTILNREWLEISDTTLDPRTRDNPLVKDEPHFRFYAGTLLHSPEGLPLGTLCVVDTKPRSLNDLQRQTLRVLGDQVMAQLELRRKIRDLEAEKAARTREEAFLHLVTDKLPVRVGYLDREYHYRFLNGAYERAFGFAPGEGIGRTVAELTGEEAFRIAKPFLDRALEGDTHTQELTVPYPFGTRRVEVQYVADHDEKGAVQGVVIHVLDVTERFAATEALREREARYRTLFDTIEEGFCVIELLFDGEGRPIDYRFREFNPAFTRFTGITAEDVRDGRTAREIYPTLEEFWFETYGRVAETGESVRLENRAEAMDKWFEVHAFRIGGEGSPEVGVLFKDVSERRREENARAEERVWRDRTLENAQVATFDLDVPSGQVGANPLLDRFFGIATSPADQAIEAYFAAIHPDDRDATKAAIEASLASGLPYEMQYRVVDVEGRERSVLARGDATYGPDGTPLRLSGVVLDITERVRAEAARRSSEDRYKTLFNSLDDGFCVIEMLFDADGSPVDYRFKEVNEAFEDQTGISPREVATGRTIRQIAPGHESHWFEIYGGVATTGKSVRFENEAKALGRWYDVHAFRLGGEGSVEVGVLFKDVTQRRREEQAIAEERARRDRTLETVGAATFDWDVTNDRLYGNALLSLFYGVPQREEGSSIELYGRAIHPEDEPAARQGIIHALATGERYEVQYRVNGADLRERSVLVRGDVTLDAEGRPLRLSGVILDLTERASQAAERERLLAELAVERSRLESLFRMSPSAIAVIRGTELRFEYANEAYLRLVGGREVVGKTLAEALPEIPGQGFADLLLGVMETGEPYQSPEASVLLRLAGDESLHAIYVDLLYQAIREADGTVSGVFVHAVDVTDQVLSRKTIAEREELFRTVFQQAPDDAILVLDVGRVVTAWNPAAERITGWKAEDAIGQLGDLLFTPEDLAAGAPDREIRSAAMYGKTEDERWHVRKDGTRFWGSGTMNALHADDGRVRGYLKVFRDATERYEETQTLAFLSLLTEAVIDQRDASAILETAERMTGQYLGVSRVLFAEIAEDGERMVVRDEWATDGPSAIGSHRIADFGPKVLADFRAGRTHVSRDVERDFDPGEGLEAAQAVGAISGISVPIHKDGRLVALFVVHNESPRNWTADEISLVQQVSDRMFAEVERARAEAALREANQTLEARVEERTAELQRAVQEAEGFNYSISHDLRTPLRAMVSTASILLEELGPELDQEHQMLLVRQADNAKRMGRLIDELLRLSRLARVPVNREPLDMTTKVRSVIGEIQESGEANGCRFEVQEGMAATGDRGLVRTILHNLIGNACKFSPSGSLVQVGQDGATFFVRDAGVGFDMKYAPKIFLPFERLVLESEFPGTGIGLANVKRIVERHGGRVWVESAPGEGATFFFTLG